MENLGDGPNHPVVRTLDDSVEKVIRMLLAGERNLRIEVDRSPVPALRDDAVKDCSSPMFVINPWQQNAEFGCDAGPGLVLQAALAEHTFEKGLGFNQACHGDADGHTVSRVALQRCFPAGAKTVIDPKIGSEQGAIASVAKVLDRAELDFHLTRLRDGRIRAVEWTIGLGSPAPASKDHCRNQRRDAAGSHGTGRKTQIAAGSFDRARTATKSRSSSGANDEVRAPDIVGTRA